jgi:hypothetical protein
MKKFIYSLFAIILLLFVCDAAAQNFSIKERWTIRLGYSQYPGKTFGMYNNFRAELNYGILNFAEIGAYGGYSEYENYPIPTEADTMGVGGLMEYAPTPSYGVSASVHLLPLVLKRTDFWMDLYVSGKYGGYCVLSKEGYYPKRKNVADYGIYGGLAVYPSEHIGLFAEYGYGNKTNLRFGLSVKF